jgi:hypothetical protein
VSDALPSSNGETTSGALTSGETSDTSLIERDHLGRFVAGTQGNPKGRPVGSKNRTHHIKQAIEEAMARDNAEAIPEIMQKAVDLARDGDKDMIKFVLGDFMKEVRGVPNDEDEASRGPRSVKVNITQYFGPDKDEKDVNPPIEGEYTTGDDPQP